MFNEVNIINIVSLILGSFLSILGIFINKHHNFSLSLNDDDKKNNVFLTSWIGSNLFLIGLIILFTSIVFLFLNIGTKFSLFSFLFIIFITSIKASYGKNKYN